MIILCKYTSLLKFSSTLAATHHKTETLLYCHYAFCKLLLRDSFRISSPSYTLILSVNHLPNHRH